MIDQTTIESLVSEGELCLMTFTRPILIDIGLAQYRRTVPETDIEYVIGIFYGVSRLDTLIFLQPIDDPGKHILIPVPFVKDIFI